MSTISPKRHHPRKRNSIHYNGARALQTEQTRRSPPLLTPPDIAVTCGPKLQRNGQKKNRFDLLIGFQCGWEQITPYRKVCMWFSVTFLDKNFLRVNLRNFESLLCLYYKKKLILGGFTGMRHILMGAYIKYARRTRGRGVTQMRAD